MCGRFALFYTLEQLAADFGLALAAERDWEFAPSWNLAPTRPVAAIRRTRAGAYRLSPLRWGLVPHWAKAVAATPLINARAETLATKPAFRPAFGRRHCVLPASGFYEWKRAGKAKEPFYFHDADERALAFAGLWERWRSPEGDVVDSCAIITTAANTTVAPVHARMPVLLYSAAISRWLAPSGRPAEELVALLRPAPESALVGRRVGAFVNNTRHDGPECMTDKE